MNCTAVAGVAVMGAVVEMVAVLIDQDDRLQATC